jgi:hypothetical protein
MKPSKTIGTISLPTECTTGLEGGGFMSGMNAILDATDKPKRDLAAMSFEDKKHFLGEYCDGHPLQIYMEGVVKLMRSLPVMQQAQ